MKLLHQIMTKQLTLYEEFKYRKFELRSLWCFYQCYNLALAYLGIEDPKMHTKNREWEYLLYSIRTREKDIGTLLWLQEQVPKDLAIVTRALSEMEKRNAELGLDGGDIWKPKALAVLAFEVMD